jgi:hypothetical protein
VSDETERAWAEGHRAALRGVLGHVLGNLNGDREGDRDAALARAVAELEDVRSALRRICATHGDNDWEDTLHLGDVLEKHLERHLDEADDE